MWSAKSKHWKDFKIVKGKIQKGVSQLGDKGVFMKIPEDYVGIAKNTETGLFSSFPAGTSTFLDREKYCDAVILKLGVNEQILEQGEHSFKYIKVEKNKAAIVFDREESAYKFIETQGEYLLSDQHYDLDKSTILNLGIGQNFTAFDDLYIVKLNANELLRLVHSQSGETIELREGFYHFPMDEWQDLQVVAISTKPLQRIQSYLQQSIKSLIADQNTSIFCLCLLLQLLQGVVF